MSETTESIKFYSPKEAPFEIYGLYKPLTEDVYKRVPDDVAKATSAGVAGLAKNTAGGRIRFATDSKFIIIRAKTERGGFMYHCTPEMQVGFDIYEDNGDKHRFLGTFPFAAEAYRNYESRKDVHASNIMSEYTINMPLYGGVTSVEIGLEEGAALKKHSAYKHECPIVYYGSSITQGACASRPGLCYQNYITRRFDCNHINLGFSGNAKGEDAIVDYMASLDMCAFVCDYDHNAPSAEHLHNTHHKIYEKIRAAHPNIPYYMVSKPDFYFDEGSITRRDIIMESYLEARKKGDKRVYFIDGSAFYTNESRGDCSLDNCHPTDLGFKHMATLIGDVLENTLKW